ncbi:hypothetical protein SAMN05661091_1191 [Paenibacillus uliginis N3/975]|uniref:Uncharacterized protein n=1 Tax=Paenibacillus uliginis N3/975 TaxID=1313296 RepID=A0A1X7GW19_9BACL|nr:DUF2161 family putative PD-(D/E)XK-type phosphodiesterase [Paenibacillus uliginis]SMF75375.1 hypothetical protein SAMN05661091_1191 [Paenibacillus uliginis N3/975]
MAIKHESELYAPLKTFFELHGFNIKAEVRNCDMVGMKDSLDEPLIVEMKKTFNLALLLQGLERLKMSPLVYLAVEKSRAKKGAVNQRWSELSSLCRKLGLGLITVTFYKTKAPLVEVLCEPGEGNDTDRKAPRRREKLLVEFRERSGDYNTGGVTRAKLVTAYREKALRVAAAIQQLSVIDKLTEAPGSDSELSQLPEKSRTKTDSPLKSGITPAAIRNLTGVGNTAAILQHNYYGWFDRVGRGRYILTKTGLQALQDYASVLESSSISGHIPYSSYTNK